MNAHLGVAVVQQRLADSKPVEHQGNECNAVITCLPAHMTLARPIALTLYREKERGPVELTCGAALQVRVNVNWRVKNTGNKA